MRSRHSGTARLIGLALAHPPHRIRQAEAGAEVARIFRGRVRRLERLLRVFDRAGIETRFLTLPPASYRRESCLADRNRVFIEAAEALCGEAAAGALEDAGLSPGSVTHVVLVTTTGLATPTLETSFGPGIGLPATVRRIPVWGLGCAGGVSGLALARELAQEPSRIVLVVAVELCSLTFLREDTSDANIVATALFADGAGAAVVTSGPGPHGLLLGHHVEELLPHSREVMGWDLTTRGLQVVFLRRIPALVRSTFRGTVERALAPHGLRVDELVCLATHPGGRKVVETQEVALGLPRERFRAAWEALRRYGNVSSVSVFQVLSLLRQKELWSGPGILSAFGPGFTSHVMALPGRSR